MSESWMELVERGAWRSHPLGSSPDVISLDLAEEMAEDAEVGRLLRELEACVEPMDPVDDPALPVKWVACNAMCERFGPTPLAALQALAEAVKE